MTTIRDIAAMVGVSIGTVSHVLNHPDRVAVATRVKVEDAMQRLDWHPNVSAQNLRRERGPEQTSASSPFATGDGWPSR